MAERPNVKDILAAARRGGPAKPAAEPVSQSEREAGTSAEPDEPMELSSAPEPEAEAVAPAPTVRPPVQPSGRPLTLKEKLAAARAGGAAAPAPPPKPTVPDLPAEELPAPLAEIASEAPSVPAPAPSPGRPLTLKEKLAAARAGGATAPAAAPGAKPAAAKAATGTAAPKAAAARTLPPLDKMTDPKDLAEALRRAGAEKEKAAKAAVAAKAAEAAGATPAGAAAAAKAAKAPAKPKVVPPKPSREASLSVAQAERRGFLVGLGIGTLSLSWIAVGWAAFTAGMGAFTVMMGRFMFPNVLAEPPSTIKVGLPSDFEEGEVNERWKAQWGFWIVRSNYNGQDMVYALQAVCTHLGCPPNWLGGEQKFKCPCHGSGYYISGVNFEGPAPRPLERFKVVLDEGQIVVDKSQKYQEELGQWSDPESFIPV